MSAEQAAAARAEIEEEMRQPVSHRMGGDIDDAVTVLLAEYDRREAEVERLLDWVAELERRAGLGRRAAQLWADAWRHRRDAPDGDQAERGDQLEAALDALAAAHGIEMSRP